MNKTLVILGNGFDLDLGWKTSYSDFYRNKYQKFENINRMSYIKEMILGDYWYDLEGYIRNCILNLSIDKIEELNNFWILCRNLIGDYLSINEIYTTSMNSCAYTFLCNIRNSDIVSFNYTDPFTKNHLGTYNIQYVHGELKNRITGAEIKLGVDSSVKLINQLANDKKIECIIKTHNNININTFLSKLYNSNTIIIYGHSLGITDSDYFSPFFKAIIEDRIKNKDLYIITYNEESLQSIKNNMLCFGFNYSDLLLSNINLKTIFTSKGKYDSAFQEMINNVNL